MFTFHTQQQPFYHLPSMRMKEKPLEEKVVSPRNQCILVFPGKPIPLTELVRKCSVVILFQTDFSVSHCKAFGQYYVGRGLK